MLRLRTIRRARRVALAAATSTSMLVAVMVAAVATAGTAGASLAGRPDAGFGAGGFAALATAGRDVAPLQVAAAPGGGTFLMYISCRRTPLSCDGVHFRKLKADGTLDTTYGGGDQLLVTGTATPARFLVQPDGKVVAFFNGSARRLLANGQPDTTFGTNGTATTSVGAAGAIVLADHTYRVLDQPVATQVRMTKLKADGTVDPTFGAGGSTTLATPGATSTILVSAFATTTRGLVILGTSAASSFLWGYTNAGATDAGFGTSGAVAIARPGETMAGYSLAVSGSSLVVAGEDTFANGTSSFVSRYADNGVLDPTFADNGTGFFKPSGSPRAPVVAVDATGGIVVAGTGGGGPSTAFRLTPDGSELDTTFGNDGTETLPFTAAVAAPAISAGRIVIAGAVGAGGGADLVTELVALTDHVTPSGSGYRFVAADGGIFDFGTAGFFGSTGGIHLNQPIVGMATTPAGRGYWLVATDGGIFAFGDAGFFGSTGGIHLNEPIVGMASTPSGHGYWLVASDGGIFAFGDAGFFGSTGGIHLNEPIVGMAATPTGRGYWLVASDGGVFAFGDAGFFGSTGDGDLLAPIVGIVSSHGGHGYWIVGADGSVYAFGDAPFVGDLMGIPLNRPIVALAPTPDGDGYWLSGSDGGIFSFGDAPFLGSTGSYRLNQPIVGLAASS